jgi:hypothetical protein
MPRRCRSHVLIFDPLGIFLLLFLLFSLVSRQFGVPPFKPQTWLAIKLFRRSLFLPLLLLLLAFILVLILIMILRFLAVEVLERDRGDRG